MYFLVYNSITKKKSSHAFCSTVCELCLHLFLSPLDRLKSLVSNNNRFCEVKHLEPYTDYTCEIQLLFENKLINKSKEIPITTSPGGEIL